MNTFEDMTNSELKEACEDFGLEVKAKNPGKPNKGEYLTALTMFKEEQDLLHKDKIEEKKEKPVKVKESASKRKPQTASQLQKLDLFQKKRVIVRDMQEAQTKDEMVSVSWGNRRIGRQTDWIDLSGEPQYVRQGALNNLKDASMVVHTPKAGGSGGAGMARKSRFVIVDVEPLTIKEIEELKAQQSMRNSKVA